MTRGTRRAGWCLVALWAFGGSGCATQKGYDYAAFSQNPPRSILVLPPLNESLSIEATDGYLSTVTRPLVERGYYVFPVAVIDNLLKENGMPTAGEMHQVPLAKVRAITGADAVLYPTVHQYGSTFYVVHASTRVNVSARLVDTRTGTLLWAGTGAAEHGSQSTGDLRGAVVAALITQVINSKTDSTRPVCRVANGNLFFAKGRGLPYGPYHPDFGKYP